MKRSYHIKTFEPLLEQGNATNYYAPTIDLLLESSEMKKNSTSSHNLATFPSPSTRIFQDNNVECCKKGWSSERVPLPVNISRRNSSGGGAAAAMMPFNSGRTLPSKWEDAERWITSPIYGYGGGTTINKASIYHVHRRPMSKSGPIAPSGGAAHYPNYSPSMPVLEGGGSVRNFMVSSGSPFSAEVIATEADGDSDVLYGGGGSDDGNGQSYVLHNGHSSMPHSASLPECSDLLSESSLPSSQDGKLDGIKDEKNVESGAVSRRDMATQMSPEGSTNSSLRGWSSSPSFLPVTEPNNHHSTKLEVRDVQVDKWTTVLRQWSKRYGGRRSKRDPPDVEDFFKSAAADERDWPWDVADAAKKFQREEAKITAWENLQKAKAEAAIKRLEMKLEKKRSSSMDKIMKKLRATEMKAQEMRSSSSDKLSLGVYKNKNVQMGWLSSCLTCHAC